MSKTGRKRKTGDRYPSGDLKRVVERPAALIKRMVALAQVSAADPLLATPLGWLRVQGVLNDRQVAAGTAFAALVGQHDRLLGLPRRSSQSPSYMRGFSGSRSTGSDASDPQRVASVRQRYDHAIAALRHADPSGRVVRVVSHVCVDDGAPSWPEQHILIGGLDLLVTHFRLMK